MRRFWFLNRQIDRLEAATGLSQISILASATSPESYQQAVEGMKRVVGEIAVVEPSVSYLDMDDGKMDPEFDRDGLLALKSKSRAI